jgi:uncharacterized protein YndB with AHSA1/START domain
MNLFERLILKESTEINTTPEKIWEFFINLEKNYKSWHPKDHIIFKWTHGKPMETGSQYYGEEIMNDRVKKFKGTIGEVIPYRKIVFNFTFPVTLVSPYFEWQIEPKGKKSVFTAITIVRFKNFYRKIMGKKGWNKLIETGEKHVREEGENLKKILESSSI